MSTDSTAQDSATPDSAASKTPRPQSVSALLRRCGLTVVSTRNREGIYVSGARNSVAVSVSIDDSARRERELADLVERVLTDRGCTLTRNGNVMHVTGRDQTKGS